MKQRTIKLLAALLAVTLTFISIPHAGADTGKNADILLIGDVDGDNSLTIVDATVIQRRLADLRTLTELEEFLGDTDGDGVLSIVDATFIQRKLAELNVRFWRNNIYLSSARANMDTLGYQTYYPTHSYNGAVLEGTEAQIYYNADRFYAHGIAYPTCYDIYINNEKIADHTEQRYFNYLFEKAGVYTVRVVPYNLFGEGSDKTRYITVTESPERPYIADAEFDKEARTLSVRAAGGAGDYRYRYYIRYVTPEPPTEAPTEAETEAVTEPPFGYEPQPDGTYQMVSDYTDASTIRIPDAALNTELEYLFYVCAVDKNGVESPLSYVFTVKF